MSFWANICQTQIYNVEERIFLLQLIFLNSGNLDTSENTF